MSRSAVDEGRAVVVVVVGAKGRSLQRTQAVKGLGAADVFGARGEGVAAITTAERKVLEPGEIFRAAGRDHGEGQPVDLGVAGDVVHVL